MPLCCWAEGKYAEKSRPPAQVPRIPSASTSGTPRKRGASCGLSGLASNTPQTHSCSSHRARCSI
eukprot:6552041-Lingulodinium_polyedra.AAC.1